jgi:hypothetical protein
VRRSHPRLYRAEGMLDRLAAQAHLVSARRIFTATIGN